MGRRLRLTDPTTTPAPAPCYRAAPDVVRLALRLAGGDRKLLRVVGPDCVVVVNGPTR